MSRDIDADEDSGKAAAAEQVSAFQDLIFERYGIEEKDLREMVRYLVDLRARDLRWRKRGQKAAMAALLGLIGAFAAAFGDGFFHMFIRLFHLKI